MCALIAVCQNYSFCLFHQGNMELQEKMSSGCVLLLKGNIPGMRYNSNFRAEPGRITYMVGYEYNEFQHRPVRYELSVHHGLPLRAIAVILFFCLLPAKCSIHHGLCQGGCEQSEYSSNSL